jgi:hypothetical protein
MQQPKRGSTTSFAPVFLLCSERSGSNLFIRLLDSHPEFCGPPPSHLIRTLALNMTRFGDIKQDASAWERLLDVSARIMENQLGVWQSSLDVRTLSQSATERSVRGIIAAIYDAEACAQNKTRSVIKENRIHAFLPYLISAFPDARYVWVVRDPRDMALSWKQSANHPGDVRRGTQIWQQDQLRFRQIFGYLAPSERILRLRYEDIVQTPESSLVELCKFLGVTYDPAMLGFHEKKDTKANAGRIANWENLAKPLLSDNTEKFRAGLTKEEIAHVESVCATEMLAHEYVLTGEPQASEQAQQALEAQQGAEDLTLQWRALTQAEQSIREGRQQVIDYINTLPIRFTS